MSAGTFFVLALVLACPLLMFWMHGRGLGGHGAHEAHGGQGGDSLPRPASLEELREVRADIDARIAEFEQREVDDCEQVPA